MLECLIKYTIIQEKKSTLNATIVNSGEKEAITSERKLLCADLPDCITFLASDIYLHFLKIQLALWSQNICRIYAVRSFSYFKLLTGLTYCKVLGTAGPAGDSLSIAFIVWKDKGNNFALVHMKGNWWNGSHTQRPID